MVGDMCSPPGESATMAASCIPETNPSDRGEEPKEVRDLPAGGRVCRGCTAFCRGNAFQLGRRRGGRRHATHQRTGYERNRARGYRGGGRVRVAARTGEGGG